MPRAVENFIKRNEFPKDIFYFAIATCGGTPGNTMKNLDNLLRDKECKLSAGFTVKENNYNLMEANIFMKFMILIGGRQPGSFTSKKEIIINYVKERKENKFESSSWLANKIGDILHNTALDQLRNNVNDFYVNSNCIGCGTCVNICPKDNIEIKAGKPVWSNDCESCFGCIQWCQQKAIEFKGYEGNKERSHNGNISLNNMLYYLSKKTIKEGIDQNE
jgi:ferredoxin